ncbi:Outer membrane protein/protective antigen OMA87 [Salinivirga cyanobacteriivorans]|uniref:Outer membrane protein/protective antigen OMA87 n=2 Tax=Salinivirga cyanobacteriivorans TaxID=1307839 RepID=A0A0S2I1F5_9BACT|nr:Outer membrane protein/protective antigen OMA87 [Salinivirga cyanobacteriivorans]
MTIRNIFNIFRLAQYKYKIHRLKKGNPKRYSIIRRTKLLAFLFIFIVQSSVGQDIYLMKIVDQDIVSSIKSNDTADFQNSIRKKLTDFHSQGFINSNLDSIYRSGDTITGIIHKGEKHFWTNLTINSDEKLLQGLPEHKIKHKTPVNLIKVKRYKKELLEYLENNGYPFAQVNSNFEVKNYKLKLNIHLEPGQKYTYDSIVFNDIKIADSFLWRYLNIIPGDVFNNETLSEISDKIQQLSYLELSAEPLISFENKLARTDLRLKKINANYFDGLLGIVPDEDRNNKYMLTGELELSLLNNLGFGEQLELEWKKTRQLSQQLDAAINWPYLLRSPLGVNGKVEMLKEDTSFVRLTLRGGLFVYFNGTNSATGYYKNKQTIVLSPEDTTNILATNAYGTGLEIIWQQKDSKLNPGKGYMIFSDLGAGRRIVQNPSIAGDLIKANYIEGKLTLQGILPVYQRWSVLLQNQLEGIYSDKKIYKNELLRIGGLKTLRGFDENDFFSRNHSISTIELRWLFELYSHFKIFADAGWINAQRGTDRTLLRVLGFGTGVNLNTNAGIFSISYALGKTNNQPVKLNNAKIHFGYINNF